MRWRHYDVGNVRHFVRVGAHQYTVTLEEGERQLVLMSLADLSLKCPGFDYALNETACKIDNVADARAVLYDEFRKLRGVE